MVQSTEFTHHYLGLVATISVFMIVIYLNGVRIELPMSYAGYKGFRSKYPIKLLTSQTYPLYSPQHCLQTFTSSHNSFGLHKGVLHYRNEPIFPNNWRLQQQPGSGNIQPRRRTSILMLRHLMNIQQVAIDPLRAAAYLGSSWLSALSSR